MAGKTPGRISMVQAYVLVRKPIRPYQSQSVLGQNIVDISNISATLRVDGHHHLEDKQYPL